jgi:hypothetical protein
MNIEGAEENAEERGSGGDVHLGAVDVCLPLLRTSCRGHAEGQP